MENKVNSGVVFSNRKTKDTQPDYRGTINVEGKELELAMWSRNDRNGNQYFSVVVSEPRKRDEQPMTKGLAPAPNEEEEKGDLPF